MNDFSHLEVRGDTSATAGPLSSPRATRSAAAVVLSLLMVTAGLGWAASTIVFGPQVYTRATGKPVAVKKTFRVPSPSGRYTLRVTNHGVTSAVVSVNGHVILGPMDFTHIHGRPWRDDEWWRHLGGKFDDVHGEDGRGRGGHDGDDRDDRHGRERDRRHDDEAAVPFLARPVTLRAGNNEIVVEVRGVPRTSLSVVIVSDAAADTTDPTITGVVTPAPNAHAWNKTDATVTFTCHDNAAVASCSAPVVVTAEGAGQVVVGTAKDTAGNTATASVTLNIDKTAPTVSVALSPAPGPDGSRNLPVTAHFTCSDSGSGIATCPADIVVRTEGQNQTVTGVAIDVAGNTASVTSAPFSTPRVQGTASLGAAISGAAVTLVDAAGGTVSGTTASDGTFALNTAGLTPPFLVKIVTATASGAFPAGTTLYSVSADANRSTQINVSVLTDLILRSYYSAQGIDPGAAFANPIGANAAPSPTAVQSIANLVIPAVQLWLDKAGVLATAGPPAGGAVNLISSPFVAYPPGVTPPGGLDAVLHEITSELLNATTGAVSQVTIVGGTITETMSTLYANDLITLNTTTIDAATGSGSSGSFSALALTSQLQPVIDGLNATLAFFKNTVNSSGGNLTGNDLLPIYAPDYLNDGLNAIDATNSDASELNGITFTRLEVVGIKSLNTTTNVATVLIFVTITDGVEFQSGVEELTFKNFNGSWLLYGNQRVGDVGVSAQSRTAQGGASLGPGVSSGTFIFAGASAPLGVITGAVVAGPVSKPTGPVDPNLKIWNGNTSAPLVHGAQFIDNGKAFDQFYLLSQNLGSNINTINSQVPAGSGFTITLATTTAGSQQYTVQSNAFTTEVIHFNGLPAHTPLTAVVGQTVPYTFTLPSTYPIGGVFLFAQIFDGLPNNPATHGCSIGGGSSSLSLDLVNHTGSGSLSFPANMSVCGLAGSPIQFVNVFLEVDGVNTEDNIVQLAYPY